MPTHASNASDSAQPEASLTRPSASCPLPTPPPDDHGLAPLIDGIIQDEPRTNNATPSLAVSDNTATGMSHLQEESLYTSPQSTPDTMHTSPPDQDIDHDLIGTSPRDLADDLNNKTVDQDVINPRPEFYIPVEAGEQWRMEQGLRSGPPATADGSPTISKPSSPTSSVEDRKRGFCGTPSSPGVPRIDQELDWSDDQGNGSFAHRCLRPQYPSATFQPYSVFKGTQQSDRQTYNVEVTILTVDIEQASMSGYLQICGLTPDHPTLTTFFTGEIIGGPNQRYTFRTGDPSWGASDKTDLTHWARFPAWRPLSLHAKRNINFAYPMNREDWWQQEHIFMRWKEHFLVPDYKLKSIQGASFEGFYYICFNQVEGRVSGIYFHSKSER